MNLSDAVARAAELGIVQGADLVRARELADECPPVYDGGSLISEGGPALSRFVTDWSRNDHA